MKIKVKEIVDGCMPKINPKGDWIDLISAEEVTFARRGDSGIISLGVAMELPKGYEAVINPRSSIHKHFKVLLSNSQGVVDSFYKGDNDVWGAPVWATTVTTIKKGERICQFRVQLSQFATPWQKIKWLFSSPVKLVGVNKLGNNSRGGFGTSGK